MAYLQIAVIDCLSLHIVNGFRLDLKRSVIFSGWITWKPQMVLVAIANHVFYLSYKQLVPCLKLRY